jgi:sulfate adenylyltransferase subunit 1
MRWYAGPSLLEHLEGIESSPAAEVPARFPVQMVVRPRSAEHPDYRGYAGRVEAGTLHAGDPVVVLPSGRTSTVAGIDTPDGALDEAAPGRSVVVRLDDDIDIARGDLIAVDRDPRPTVVRSLTATVCWLAEQPLRPGDRFALRHGTRDIPAVVDAVKTRLDITTLKHDQSDELQLNDIGAIRLRTAEPVPVDPYQLNRSTGAFLLVDEDGGATVAAGMVAAPSE